MKKKFNTAGLCIPKFHYMVNLDTRLAKIRELISASEYFVLNKARQYGKTTILHALAGYLNTEYTVVSLDFQMMSHSDFESESAFSAALAREILAAASGSYLIPPDIEKKIRCLNL